MNKNILPILLLAGLAFLAAAYMPELKKQLRPVPPEDEVPPEEVPESEVGNLGVAYALEVA